MRTPIIFLTIFVLLAGLTVSVTVPARAQPADCQTNDNGVCLLQPDIIGEQPGFQEASLGHYLNLLFGILIGLTGGISVLYIVVGGLQYILSEVPGIKTSGKEKIRDALVGLILALAAYLILYTINPDLVNLNFKLNPLGKTSFGP